MDKKILIVDSNQKDRKAMEEVLTKVGHKNIQFAKTGKEGIEKVKREKPKIVIVALILPDYKGFEVCEIIKSIEGPLHKVILITGKLKTIDNYWLKNTRADAFIVKSDTYESLCQTVSRLARK